MRSTELLHYQIYDSSGKDFDTISMRAGDAFIKAEKGQEIGTDLVNTLFQNDMLFIFDDDDELRKLGVEFLLLLRSTPKQKAKDDLADTARYNVMQIPWDFSHIRVKTDEETASRTGPKTDEELRAEEIAWRRGETPDRRTDNIWEETQGEIDYWNDLYGT
jgi:hypothetical protein